MIQKFLTLMTPEQSKVNLQLTRTDQKNSFNMFIKQEQSLFYNIPIIEFLAT